MKTVVLKFGGKTIASIEKIKLAAKRISDCIQNSYRTVVVVSAMGEETDELIELAANIDGCGFYRELDHLLCTGEIKAAALLSMQLLSMGINAKSLDFTSIGIKTNDDHTNAIISSVDPTHVLSLLDDNIVPIIPGYQGMNELGDVTTLGRGGSDTTAVCVASAINADECILFKDVGAIFYEDPKLNNNAKKFDSLTYSELQKIVNNGSKVICQSSIELAKKNKLVLSVACPETFNVGTMIRG